MGTKTVLFRHFTVSLAVCMCVCVSVHLCVKKIHEPMQLCALRWANLVRLLFLWALIISYSILKWLSQAHRATKLCTGSVNVGYADMPTCTATLICPNSCKSSFLLCICQDISLTITPLGFNSVFMQQSYEWSTTYLSSTDGKSSLSTSDCSRTWYLGGFSILILHPNAKMLDS